MESIKEGKVKRIDLPLNSNSIGTMTIMLIKKPKKLLIASYK